MAAVELDERLGLHRGGEELAAMRQRDHLVLPGMQEELRHANARNLVDRAEAVPDHPSHRYKGIQLLPALYHGAEGTFYDEAGYRDTAREIDRDGRSE